MKPILDQSRHTAEHYDKGICDHICYFPISIDIDQLRSFGKYIVTNVEMRKNRLKLSSVQDFESKWSSTRERLDLLWDGKYWICFGMGNIFSKTFYAPLKKNCFMYQKAK